MEGDRILVIQTGGTIDKDYPKRTGGYAFEICDSAVNKIATSLGMGATWDFRTVCRKDSQDITQDDRQSILQACQESPNRRVLITHGTDTIIETGQFLASHKLDKVVVLTGSYLPHTFKGSDAEFNVGFAVGCLKSTSKTGVYVAMCANLFHCDDVTRDAVSGEFIKKT